MRGDGNGFSIMSAIIPEIVTKRRFILEGKIDAEVQYAAISAVRHPPLYGHTYFFIGHHHDPLWGGDADAA
jgi:hypothetical protein